MNLAKISAYAVMQAVGLLFDGGSLVFYSGTQPSTPETALSGNTALATFTFSATAYGAPAFSSSNEQITASFAASTVTPSNSGTCTFARATLASAAWAASHSYSLGAIVSNNSNFYVCVGAGTSAASGGPTTTAAGIVDGTAVWNYIGATAGQGNVLADFTVGTSGTDIIVGSTSFSTGVQVNLSSFVLELPAS